LLDDWETRGLSFIADDVTYFLDLPDMGADPLHKDVFVEVDGMGNATSCTFLVSCTTHNHRPDPGALSMVRDSFSNADITLHIDAGPDSCMKNCTASGSGVPWGTRSKANVIAHDDVTRVNYCPFGDKPSEIMEIRKNNFSPGRNPVFHYAVFAHAYTDQCSVTGDPDGESSGITPGDPGQPHTILVTLGHWTNSRGSQLEQAGTFMHELGHDLGLDHGGPTGLDIDEQIKAWAFKPNYLSVMDYAYQMGALLKNDNPVIDYSHAALPDLDETHLDETVGIGVTGNYTLIQYWCRNGQVPDVRIPQSGTQLDWNCNGTTDDSDVEADIDFDPTLISSYPPNGINAAPLKSFDDWSHLNFTTSSPVSNKRTGSSRATHGCRSPEVASQ
jgi:hypothetical protein